MKEQTRRHRRGPGFWALVAVLMTVAALLVSCGGDVGPLADTTPSGATTPTRDAPPATATPGLAPTRVAPTAAPEPETVGATIYLFFAGYPTQVGPYLVPVFRPGPADLLATLRLLAAGPSPSEIEQNLSSPLPQDTVVLGVTVADAIATIDVSRAFESGGGSLSMRGRVAQLVFTATRFADIDAVNLTVEGVPLTVLGGEGVLLESPQTRDDYRDLLPPIAVEEPAWGQPLPATISIAGSATTPPVDVHWVLVDGAGHIVAEGVETVSAGQERPTWKVEVTDLPSGLDALIVYALDGERRQTAVLEYPLLPSP